MDVVEVNRHFKPGKSRFGRHSRKRKSSLSWGGFADGKAQDFFWDGLALIRRGETNLTNDRQRAGAPVLFNDILGTTQGYVSSGEASTNAPSRTGEFSQITRDSFGQTLDNSIDTNYDYFTGKPNIPSNLKTQVGDKVKSLVDTSMNSGTGTTRYAASRTYDFEGVVWVMGDDFVCITSSVSYSLVIGDNLFRHHYSIL